MKIFFNRTILKLLACASLLTKNLVKSHGVELRECITDEGKLRIFVEHWHGSLGLATDAGTMQIRDDTDSPNGPISTLFPNGFINDVADKVNGLPGCASGTSALVKTCSSPQGDWVWFDFQTVCEKEIKYTFLQGNTQVLEGGCSQLYSGATITANFQDVSAPVPYLNGERCDDGDGITKTLYGTTDTHTDETAVVNFSTSAFDDCDPNPTVSTDFSSGSAFPLGNTSVTITATDNKGKMGICTFIVNVIPSAFPSALPNEIPSVLPSARPIVVPSKNPSVIPSVLPSARPIVIPSKNPSVIPSVFPSVFPSESAIPSTTPSTIPSEQPSSMPSCSTSPSSAPTSSKGKGSKKSSKHGLRTSSKQGKKGAPTAAPFLPCPAVPSSSPSKSPSNLPSVSLYPTVSKGKSKRKRQL